MAKKVPIAIQLYALRGECAKDVAATIREIAKIGYAGVEPWGAKYGEMNWLGWKAKDLRKLLDDNGLTCCGIHLGTGDLLGDSLAHTVEMNRILGNKFLIIAGDSERMSAPGKIKEFADLLNVAAEKVKPHGMFVGYHAHGNDFIQFDGQPAWDILFSHTQPAVITQMDIGNCAGGNGDPVAELKRFPGRAKTIHLKDHGGPLDSVLGDGKADWKEIFRVCDSLQPVEWYVVEEGERTGLGFDAARRSLEVLKAMGR